MSDDNDICGAKTRDGSPCQRPSGWGTPYSDGRCKNHRSDEPEKTELMDLPFFDSDDPPDSDDLAETLQEKREELSEIRERHESAREVVQEHEKRVRTLRAQDEIGEDVADEIEDLEEKLENAREKRSDLRERRDALESALSILEEKVEEMRADEVQAEYDAICEEVDERVRRVTELLSETAELQADIRKDLFKAHRLAYEYDAEDHHNISPLGGGPLRSWLIFDPVSVDDFVNDESEEYAMKNRQLNPSALENWLDMVDEQIDGIEKPDVVQAASAKTKFD